MAKEWNENLNESTSKVVNKIEKDKINAHLLLVDQIKDEKRKEAEEKEYINSDVYQNYNNLLSKLDNVLYPVVQMLMQNYMENNYYFKTPFARAKKIPIYFKNIGFPIPDKFLSELKVNIENTLNKIEFYDDADFTFELKPIGYLLAPNSEKIIKPVKSYCAVISYNKKQKEKVYTK